jgi:hypothetical protein
MKQIGSRACYLLRVGFLVDFQRTTRRYFPEENSSFYSLHRISLHQKIQFTMQTKADKHFPLLNIDIYRRPGRFFIHTLFRNPTHTNFYLNSLSLHQQANKLPVLWRTGPKPSATRGVSTLNWTCSTELFVGISPTSATSQTT